MRIRALGDRAELLTNMRRRWAVRVTHAEIDNIFAATTQPSFQFSSDILKT